MTDLLTTEWKWSWGANDDGEADCGIYAEPAAGQAYAICRCPRYLTEEQWAQIATHICDEHNSSLRGPHSWQLVI